MYPFITPTGDPWIDPIELRPAKESFSIRSFLVQLTSTSCANVPKDQMATGGDISSWQGEMDWNAYFDNGMQFTIARAMINGVIDTQFERNAKILAEQNRLFLVYGATGYPTLSNAIPYAKALASIVKGMPYLGVWWDAEASGNLTPTQMATYTSEVLGELAVQLPNTVLEIYTRQTFWDTYVAAGNWSKYPLAAARYNTSLTCPWSDGLYKFRDWSDWRYWQDSQWWDGKKFGAKSTYIDHDYFNGTLDDFKQTYNVGVVVPPVDPELEKRVQALEDQMIVVNTKQKDFEKRITALENAEPIEPKATLTVEITEKHAPHYYKLTDKSCSPDPGKPIMLTYDGLPAFTAGQTYECNRSMKLSCKDDENTPFVRASGYNDTTLVNVFYRIAEGPYVGRFIRADKSKPLE